MTDTFGFRLLATDGNARLGRIDTPRGQIRTPAFMPVGTAGTVKALYLDQVRAAGSDIILGNTYHLMIRPGAERIASLGGLTGSSPGTARSSPIRAVSRSCRWPSCAR
jgi:queuine tRNA-ribosyltransferase